MKCRTIFLFLVFLLSVSPLCGQSVVQWQDPNQDSNQHLNIAKSVMILQDIEGSLTFEQILKPEKQRLFKPNTKEVLSFGSTQAAFWLKFQLTNATNEPLGLEIDRGTFDSLALYVYEDSTWKVQQTGCMLPRTSRQYDIHYFLFDLPTQKNATHTYYLRVRSNKTLIIPTIVASKTTLLQRYGEKSAAQGIYFGCLLLVAIYNLFIFSSMKEKAYFFYIVYVFSMFVLMSIQNGFAYQYALHPFPFLSKYSNVMYLISLSCYAFFCIHFLNLKNYPIFLRIYQGFLIALAVLFVWFLVGGVPPMAVNLLRLVVATLSITTFVTAFSVYKKGYKPAKYFAIACVALIVTAIITALRDTGVVPYNSFTNYAFQMGSALEMIFLFFALADKINQLKEQKQVAEAQTLKAIAENARLIQEQNVVLEQKVEERTTQLRDAVSEIEVQNEELRQQQEELLTTNEALDKQRLQIQEQKSQLETTFLELKRTSDRLDSSIRYAQQIQAVILPDYDALGTFFTDFFVIYLPKDVVSGDFYWFKKLPTKQTQNTENYTDSDKKMLASIKQKINLDFDEDFTDLQQPTTTKTNNIERAIFITADCTGHGVPGAFMTMIANTLLFDIISNDSIYDPAKILKILNLSIIQVLRQDEGKNADGMDISIGLFEKDETKQVFTLHFGGAKSSIFYTKNGEILRLSGNRSFLGGHTNRTKHFDTQSLQLLPDSMVYFATDGFADQNNPARESFGLSRFRNLLEEVYLQPLHAQKQAIVESLQTHQQQEPQRDDITVIGLHL